MAFWKNSVNVTLEISVQRLASSRSENKCCGNLLSEQHANWAGVTHSHSAQCPFLTKELLLPAHWSSAMQGMVNHSLTSRLLALCQRWIFYVFRFIGSMCTSDLWVPVSVSTIGFADSTDVTLADEDTNSILTDDANRTISQASDQI